MKNQVNAKKKTEDMAGKAIVFMVILMVVVLYFVIQNHF